MKANKDIEAAWEQNEKLREAAVEVSAQNQHHGAFAPTSARRRSGAARSTSRGRVVVEARRSVTTQMEMTSRWVAEYYPKKDYLKYRQGMYRLREHCRLKNLYDEKKLREEAYSHLSRFYLLGGAARARRARPT